MRRQLGLNVKAERSDGKVFETGDEVQVVGGEIIRVLPEPQREDGRGEFVLLSLNNEEQGPAILVHVDSIMSVDDQ